MCDFGAALMIAASGAQALVGASQKAHEASVRQSAALYQAALARNAASVSDYQAQDAERRAAAEEEGRRRKTALALGTQQARFAAQGSDLMGSPIDVIGDTAATGEFDALSVRYQGEREAWLQQLQAASQRAKAAEYGAAAANIDPSYGIATSLLGGFSDIVKTAKAVNIFGRPTPGQDPTRQSL